MSAVDNVYHYIFSDVHDDWTSVRRYVHGSLLTIHAKIEDQVFASLSHQFMPPTSADLSDLALAIYVSERYTPRNKHISSIHVELPLREPKLFERSANDLQKLLYFYTGYEWTFTFSLRKKIGRYAERNHSLFPSESETLLWSGGLDALGGFFSRYHRAPIQTSFTLLGTGGNSFIHHTQESLYQLVCQQILKHHAGRVQLVQIPFRTASPSKQKKNSVPRVRGFVFLLIGSVCALLQRQHSLIINENGIGAVNLPFRPSELGWDHSRSVHPVALRLAGDFISHIVQQPFRCLNPFEGQTKGQICSDLINNVRQDILLPVLAQTVTCDSRRRAIPMQCGRCSSCLLRRLGLGSNGIIEPDTFYYITRQIAQGKTISEGSKLHLQAMSDQIYTLKQVFSSASPWQELNRHYPAADLELMIDEMSKHDGNEKEQIRQILLHLYSTYVAEWDQVEPQLCQGVIA